MKSWFPWFGLFWKISVGVTIGICSHFVHCGKPWNIPIGDLRYNQSHRTRGSGLIPLSHVNRVDVFAQKTPFCIHNVETETMFAKLWWKAIKLKIFRLIDSNLTANTSHIWVYFGLANPHKIKLKRFLALQIKVNLEPDVHHGNQIQMHCVSRNKDERRGVLF